MLMVNVVTSSFAKVPLAAIGAIGYIVLVLIYSILFIQFLGLASSLKLRTTKFM